MGASAGACQPTGGNAALATGAFGLAGKAKSHMSELVAV